jgi:hypothetical protein
MPCLESLSRRRRIFFINYRIGLALVILAWPILGALLRLWQKPFATIWINLGIVWFFLEIGTTVIALFLPMAGGLITGIPDPK